MSFTVEIAGNMNAQGGGHGRINKCTIQPGDIAGIAKPVDHREDKAYQEIQETVIAPHTPEFFGIHDIDGTNMIVISDTTAGMKSPCIADLKVGKRHYDLAATPEKRDGLIKKAENSTTPSLGVRVVDVKTRKNENVEIVYDRKQGLKYTQDEFYQAVHDFLPGNRLEEFHVKITELRDSFRKMMETYPGFRIYASSVLISYDGDDDDSPIVVKLIDLAHMYLNIADESADPGDEQYDDGVIDGLETLVRCTEPAFEYQSSTLPHAQPSAEGNSGVANRNVPQKGEETEETKKDKNESKCCLLL